MSDDQQQFEQGDAGSSDCTPSTAGQVKKGGYCMLKGFPCKVSDYSTAKPGKHGSAKASIIGIDIFTNKKYEDTWPTSANVMIPNVTKTEYEVADVDEEGFVSLIQEDGTLKQDLKLPNDEELLKELTNVWQVNKDKGQVFFTVLRAVGQQKIVSGRIKE